MKKQNKKRYWGKVRPRAVKGPAKRTDKKKSAKQMLYRKEGPNSVIKVICPHFWGQIRLLIGNKAHINKELAKSNFVFFFFRIEFNLHLIGQKMNHQAGILRIISKNQIQQRS